MPFFRRPGGVVSGSATDSVPSPAVLMTFAVMLASYSFAMPGVNAPNVAGAPSVSDECRRHGAADAALRAQRAVGDLAAGDLDRGRLQHRPVGARCS